jgi:uncharacterized protein (TIGR02246 family)
MTAARAMAPHSWTPRFELESRLEGAMNLGVVRIMAAAVAFAGLFVVSAFAVGQRDQPSRPAGDREQIMAILARWEDAWNTHDMAAFASLFHEDGVWVLWTGEVWTGRRVIEEGHAAVHKTIFRNSIQREHLEELTLVGSDAAVVRFCSVLTRSEQSPNEPIRSRKFLVVTRRQGGWKISWGQNTRLRADVPDSECFATLRKRGSHDTTVAPVSAAPSIQGTWQLVETAVRTPGGAWETRPAPQGGLFVFTTRHYSYFYVRGSEPRARFADANKPAPAEMAAAYDSFIAGAGSYGFDGRTLMLKADFRKNPNEMTGETWHWETQMGGDTVRFVFVNPPFLPGREWRLTVKRIE